MADETKITGGKVSYGLTLSPKQYESKRCDVEIVFTVAEGDSYEAVFDKATNAAVRRVREVLELQKPVAPTPLAATVTTNVKPAGASGLFAD